MLLIWFSMKVWDLLQTLNFGPLGETDLTPDADGFATMT